MRDEGEENMEREEWAEAKDWMEEEDRKKEAGIEDEREEYEDTAEVKDESEVDDNNAMDVGEIRGGCWGEIAAMNEADEEARGMEKAWDDVTGRELDWDMVLAARMEEMEEVKKHGVYTKVPIHECVKATGKKPLKVRWIDINKGVK